MLSDEQATVGDVDDVALRLWEFARDQGGTEVPFQLKRIESLMGWTHDFAKRVMSLGRELDFFRVVYSVFASEAENPVIHLTEDMITRIKHASIDRQMEREAARRGAAQGPAVVPAIDHAVRRQTLFDQLTLMPALKAEHSIRDNFIAGHFGNAIHSAFGILSTELRTKGNEPSLDGHDLASKTLSNNGLKANPPVMPKIQINALVTENEKSEQQGVMYLAMGAYAGVRNPVAHHQSKPDEAKTIEALSLVSLILRMLP